MSLGITPKLLSNCRSQDLFLALLDTAVVDARMQFKVSGTSFTVGSRLHEPLPNPNDVVIRVHRQRFFTRLLCYGNLGLGEAYMARDFEVEQGTLQDFLTILLRNRLDQRLKQQPRLALQLWALQLANAWRGKWQNVQRHYDLGDDLFEAFLDPTLTYSCGYVYTPADSLQELQRHKLERICRKLRLQSGDRLLDVGCGYGGLLIYAARNYGVTGYGLTISRQHFERGQANITKAGLAESVQIAYQDYWAVTGTFDKVVSVGMMEHLPRREYARYFSTLSKVLTPQGVGLVHMIGCTTRTITHDPFIQKYIFPGSSQVRLSDIARHLECRHLIILDVENIARHYAYTLQRWFERFQLHRATLDAARYDDRFVRMWEYYLCCGIAAASVADAAVYQVLFTKDQATLPPLQRV